MINKVQKKIILFMPSIETGGVEKNFFLISNYLIKHYKNISIITLSKKHKNRFNKKIKFISLQSNFWDSLGKRKKFLICIFLLIAEILKGNSIVFSFQGNIYCTLICKLLFTKIIVRSNSSPEGWSNNFLKKLFYKLILNLANKTIVNSKIFKKQLKSKYNLDSTYIYNPLNVKEIDLLSKKKNKYNYFKKGFLNIVSVARFSTQKDYPTLIKALELLKNKIKFKAMFVGDGDQLIKIKNLISESNLENDIRIINGEKNPFPIIKKSDLFILSSKFEGLPNVILEALSLNKFIISSNCPTGPAEILDNGKGGLLFNVGNYKELAKQIIYFKKNKNICKAKLKYARKRLFRFDYKLNLNKYKRIISKLIV